MSRYFYFGLLASAAVVFLLFIWLSHALQMNWSRRNRHGLSFLMPIFISILLILTITFEFRPRFLDFLNGLSENRLSYTISSDNARFHGNRIDVLGRRLTLPPDLRNLDPQKNYRITAGPHSGIVLQVEEIRDDIGEKFTGNK